MNFGTKLLATALMIGAFQGADAAQLVVANGTLTGATGVTVGSNNYDVSFVDGTCASVYGTCSASAFDFTSYTEAAAAAQALLDQVYIDGPDGQFDTDPTNIYGGGASPLITLVAYAADTNTFFTRTAYNASGSAADFIGQANIGKPYSATGDAGVNWARFTLVPPSAVPEPNTWATIILGFGVIGFILRRWENASFATR